METKTIYEKLLDFQNNIETIKKDGKNSFFKKADGNASSYATLPNILSAVKPILNALKIVLTQPIENGEVMTVLTDTESGEIVKSGILLGVGLNAQQTGSAVTYFRRYTLCSLLSLEIDDDDDGNAASYTNSTTQSDDGKKWLNKFKDAKKTTLSEDWIKVVEAIKGSYTVAQVEAKYKLSKELKAELIKIKG